MSFLSFIREIHHPYSLLPSMIYNWNNTRHINIYSITKARSSRHAEGSQCCSVKYIVSVQRPNLLVTSARIICPHNSQKTSLKLVQMFRAKIRINADFLFSVLFLFIFLILLFSLNSEWHILFHYSFMVLSSHFVFYYIYIHYIIYTFIKSCKMNIVKYVLKFIPHIKDKIRTILQILCIA